MSPRMCRETDAIAWMQLQFTQRMWRHVTESKVYSSANILLSVQSWVYLIRSISFCHVVYVETTYWNFAPVTMFAFKRDELNWSNFKQGCSELRQNSTNDNAAVILIPLPALGNTLSQSQRTSSWIWEVFSLIWVIVIDDNWNVGELHHQPIMLF